MAESTQVDDDPEVLRIQMEQSREALTQKIEMLEEKVTETVQSATASVAEATATVLETVQNATASVTDTVDTVTSAVQGTVDTVRQSVEGTVDTVKDAFDLSRQVEQHPWWMLGAAVAAGFVGGKLIESPAAANRRRARKIEKAKQRWQSQNGHNGQSPPPTPWQAASNGFVPQNGSAIPNVSANPAFSQPIPKTEPSWISQLGDKFGPEISKLEGLAIGVLMGSVRDIAAEAVPPGIKQQVTEVIDSFTEKLGGQPINGTVVSKPNSSISGSY